MFMTTLPVLNPKAGAVDVGSEQMHVSIAGDAPKVFGSTTAQLQALRDYLLEQGVSSVAMEATGVYWLCLYAVLEQAGLEVVMVNGRHVKNLPGRKTDMKDCQWQATLHAHGLLRGGFVPKEQIRRLQDYQRLRADHITMAATHQLHMQKALERMNIKFHDVISHLTGVSGLKVIRAILAGERDPAALLALCDPLIQKKKAARVRESLVGTWKEEHLFALRQALAGWEFYQGQIAECDRALEHVLKEIAPGDPGTPAAPGWGRRNGVNAPQIEGLSGLLCRLCDGKNPTAIPGITDYTLLQLVAETGTDLAQHWRTEKHFTAWLGVAPGSRQSGKRRGPKTFAQPCGANFLRDRPQRGPDGGQGAGGILSPPEKSAGWLGRQRGPGPQVGATLLARNGAWHPLRGRRIKEIPRPSRANRTALAAKARQKTRNDSPATNQNRLTVHGKKPKPIKSPAPAGRHIPSLLEFTLQRVRPPPNKLKLELQPAMPLL